jgi:hypothetical protein
MRRQALNLGLVLVTATCLCASAGEVPTREVGKQSVPRGVPGFMDPMTGTFTPFEVAPAATFSGIIEVKLDVRINEDIETLFCTVTVSFGNLVNGHEFPNHFVRVAINYSAANSNKTVGTPFSYAPNGNGKPYFLVVTSCTGRDSSNGLHVAGQVNGDFDLKNGVSTIEPVLVF